MASFDGMDAVVVKGNESSPYTHILYGGYPEPGSRGCGLVRFKGPIGKEKIVYWKLPNSQGGSIVIDEKRNGITGDNLSDHMSGS